MVHAATLARVYLLAVLPCLETLSELDPRTQAIAGAWNGDIRLSVAARGPHCTVGIRGGRVAVFDRALAGPDVALFFPHPLFLNNLFKGKHLVVALPWKGLTRVKGLLVFSRLASRMQAVLEGRAGSPQLRAGLTIGLLARSLAVAATWDPLFKQDASRLEGVAEFSIRGGPGAHVHFQGGKATAYPGHAPSADFILEFANSEVFLDVADDKVDVMARACLGDVSLKGDLHMGQVLSRGLDVVGRYLLQETHS
ncbi:MAG TPA: SCP2 sterol-binding domain-containing protein [Deltaproteobacteria bacterium]|nr:SCP2 sterol-binding domain-containing protein [Deltaproteobacteria bacterium]HPP80922.1 SCP2 sterol-binding domain-containing protein [Deltaproteobacteria bacterium]